MLSSLDANEFLKFTNFNKFYNRDFPIYDFFNKLNTKVRVAVKEFMLGKRFIMREEKYDLNIGDFLKHIELDDSVWNPNKRNVYNEIFTGANIQKYDFLYKLQNYFFAVSFGYNETKQLIHKYAFYNHERSKEVIDKFEYQDVFKIFEDAFLLRMKEIYKLLQNVKQLQELDYGHHVQELNDYIIKNELDNENVVI